MTETRGFDLKVFGPFCAMWEPFISALDPKEQAEKSQTHVRDSSSAMLKSVLRAELELMALASRRLQAQIHLPVELMTARNPQDAFERTVSFYQTAFEQYSKSSTKVMSIWSEAAQTVCGDVEKARDYIDFTKPEAADVRAQESVERPRHRRAA